MLDPSPPERRTPADNHATLLVSWWCTICALVIILFRIVGRYVRAGTLLSEDKFMCWGIIPLMIRMGLVHVVLIYGTNNTTLGGLTEEGIYHRTIGSRCVLAARIFYAMYIWICKLAVSEFLKRLTKSTWNRTFEWVLNSIRIFLLATFIAVVIGTLSECQPFDHYWQVVPDPGYQCRSGYVQLLVMGISDIITDIVLIIFPLPVIFSSNLSFKRKIGTSLLYSLSAFLIAIAAYRIPAIIDVHGRQQRRSLWASIEILASAAATNAVIIGSYVRDKGVKRTKYRSDLSYGIQNAEVPSLNRQLTREHWGNDSDEELFRTVRGRMDSVTSERGNTPMTPIAMYSLSPLKPKYIGPETDGLFDEDFTVSTNGKEKSREGSHPSETLDVVDAGGLLGGSERHSPSRATRNRHPSETLGMGDAGGLLGGGASSTSNTFQSPTVSFVMDFASQHREPQASAGSPEIRRTDRVASPMRRVLAMTPQQVLPPNGRPTAPGDDLELHDPGGLLR